MMTVDGLDLIDWADGIWGWGWGLVGPAKRTVENRAYC